MTENQDLDVKIQDVTNEEIRQMEDVLLALRRKQFQNVDMENYRREIIERFEEVGFVCNPLVYETNFSGVYWFTYEITGRTADNPFDIEKMIDGVVRDTLDMGEGGTINADGKVKAVAKKTSLYLPPSK